MDFSAAGELIYQWIINPMIWLLIIFFSIGVIILFLFWRKKRKLIFASAEITNLGNGKTNINFLGNKSCGWFGKNWWGPGKLWDYGDKVMRTKDGDIIEAFSEEDFQEVNGQRGVIFYRDPERHLFLPINKLLIDEASQRLAASIAPAIYTEVSADILRKAEEETKNTWEKIMPVLMFGLVVIFALVAVIVITQMVKHGQTEAANLITKGQEICLESAKSVCSQIAVASNAP